MIVMEANVVIIKGNEFRFSLENNKYERDIYKFCTDKYKKVHGEMIICLKNW